MPELRRALPLLRRILWRAGRARVAWAFGLTLASGVVGALSSVWLREIVNGPFITTRPL